MADRVNMLKAVEEISCTDAQRFPVVPTRYLYYSSDSEGGLTQLGRDEVETADTLTQSYSYLVR